MPMALIDNPTIPERRETGEGRTRHPKVKRFADGDLEASFLLRLVVFKEALETVETRRGQAVLINVANPG